MAQHRHKRETPARRTPTALQVAGPLAIAATVSAVSLGVLTASPQARDLVASSADTGAAAISSYQRSDIVSRSERRESARAQALVERKQERRQERKRDQKREARQERRQAALDARATARAVSSADTHQWTTAELNLWTGPGEDAQQVGLLDSLERVLVTGRAESGRVEVVVGGRSRWVTAGYLADEKPETGPTLGSACTNGTTAAGGDANVQKVHEAVCANWPSITTYGTLRGGGGDHPLGRAVDIMVSGPVGWDIANFVRANAAALGVTYIIYEQHIWSVERGSEGWRGMEDRGSVTANHYDHVHVSTY